MFSKTRTWPDCCFGQKTASCAQRAPRILLVLIFGLQVEEKPQKQAKNSPFSSKMGCFLVRRKGLEPPTYWFVEWLGSLNIALSYEFGGIVQTFWRTFYV